jgi:hypothetical protein
VFCIILNTNGDVFSQHLTVALWNASTLCYLWRMKWVFIHNVQLITWRLHPIIGREDLLGRTEVLVLLFFVHLGTKWGERSKPRPGRLYPRERPGTHCTGGWVGIEAGVERSGKSRPHRDLTFQPVASRYTDYAIPAPMFSYFSLQRQTYYVNSYEAKEIKRSYLGLLYSNLRSCRERLSSVVR